MGNFFACITGQVKVSTAAVIHHWVKVETIILTKPIFIACLR